MSEVIKIRKGLDINLSGEALREIRRLPFSESYGICPSDFEGLTPKLLVCEGEAVKAGTPLFFDKKRPQVLITSPVSGRVEAIRRGEKRRVLEVVVAADGEQKYEDFGKHKPETATRKQVSDLLLRSGLWPFIIQRPYGIIADPDDQPRAIFVSGFDSAPLAPDMDFVLEGREADLETGFKVLAKLTDGKVYLGVRAGAGAGERAGVGSGKKSAHAAETGVVNKIKGPEKHRFQGPHPAGNVGVQINHIAPIGKGEIVWTVDIQNVAIIGRLFNTGHLDMTRTYALTGSEVIEPAYVEAISGAPFVSLLRGNVRRQEGSRRVRVINGNVLSGKKADPRGYVSFYANQITVIPEGDRYELLGWVMPGFDKFSVSKTFFSWVCPKKRYNLDTNLHGGKRPYIVTGLFERYLPMDIYPVHLLKAILAGDIDKMENLGIYEVIEEDLALCEFVDPSKNDVQKTLREGINLMIKELS